LGRRGLPATLKFLSAAPRADGHEHRQSRPAIRKLPQPPYHAFRRCSPCSLDHMQHYDLLIQRATQALNKLQSSSDADCTAYPEVAQLLAAAWHYQQAYRCELVASGLTRPDIGDLACRIASLYYSWYLKCGSARFLQEAHVFYSAVQARQYYDTPSPSQLPSSSCTAAQAAGGEESYPTPYLASKQLPPAQLEDMTLQLKQLRFVTRFCIVCLVMGRQEVGCMPSGGCKLCSDSKWSGSSRGSNAGMVRLSPASALAWLQEACALQQELQTLVSAQAAAQAGMSAAACLPAAQGITAQVGLPGPLGPGPAAQPASSPRAGAGEWQLVVEEVGRCLTADVGMPLPRSPGASVGFRPRISCCLSGPEGSVAPHQQQLCHSILLSYKHGQVKIGELSCDVMRMMTSLEWQQPEQGGAQGTATAETAGATPSSLATELGALQLEQHLPLGSPQLGQAREQGGTAMVAHCVQGRAEGPGARSNSPVGPSQLGAGGWGLCAGEVPAATPGRTLLYKSSAGELLALLHSRAAQGLEAERSGAGLQAQAGAAAGCILLLYLSVNSLQTRLAAKASLSVASSRTDLSRLAGLSGVQAEGQAWGPGPPGVPPSGPTPRSSLSGAPAVLTSSDSSRRAGHHSRLGALLASSSSSGPTTWGPAPIDLAQSPPPRPPSPAGGHSPLPLSASHSLTAPPPPSSALALPLQPAEQCVAGASEEGGWPGARAAPVWQPSSSALQAFCLRPPPAVHRLADRLAGGGCIAAAAVGQVLLTPEDLLPLTRWRLLVVADSEAAGQLTRLSGAGLVHELAVLGAPRHRPSAFGDEGSSGSLLTLFLTRPLSALCLVLGEMDAGCHRLAQAQEALELSLAELAGALGAGLASGPGSSTWAVAWEDVMLRSLLTRQEPAAGSVQLRGLSRQFVLARSVLSWHQASRGRPECQALCVPPLPDQVSPLQPGCLRAVRRVAAVFRKEVRAGVFLTAELLQPSV
ncbi:hypothetical protein QJQ45_014938, partial [Haematococcus lacustris]